ncbi:UNVERIFIED_CONTAM: hypothetical protein FKN15_068714 [Acipenser sinensis]
MRFVLAAVLRREDFKSLKRYIQREFSGFTSLNQSHRAEIWSLLSELLLHSEALTVLDSIREKTERGDGEKLSLDMLDEELRGPVQRLGASNTEIFSLVMSFISVLDVLSGQTMDLISGLDMETLREQLELPRPPCLMMTQFLCQQSGRIGYDKAKWARKTVVAMATAGSGNEA